MILSYLNYCLKRMTSKAYSYFLMKMTLKEYSCFPMKRKMMVENK
jgi:hypothetical protein